MFKKILIPVILLCVLAGTSLPSISYAEECPPGQIYIEVPDGPGGGCFPSDSVGAKDYVEKTAATGIPSIFGTIFGGIFSGIGYVLMTLSGLILYIAGTFFDLIVKYSILDMAEHIGNPSGLGAGITAAWVTLRDIANMCFIFVLLYAAFKAMFELNFGSVSEIVKNIIIIALLINFSLFFSKVIIDASNVIAIGFYKSIVTSNAPVATDGAESSSLSGISGGYMRLLGLQTFYDASIFKNVGSMEPQNILIIGIMSSIFFLVTAIILLVSAIMFTARFVILIFLMILSPIALIAYAIPNQKKHFQEWLNALIEQSFFAPLFFALTWVTFKLAASLVPSLTTGDSFASPKFIDVVLTGGKSGSITLVLNYVIVLGFAIATLVFPKKIAMQSASVTGFSKISGGITGGAAWVGRKSFGTIGRGLANSDTLALGTKSSSLTARTLSRVGLYAGNKMGSATFDARNASVPTGVIGDVIEGTVGRTRVGKAVGLDDFKISNIEIGKKFVGGDLGEASKKGQIELYAEGRKRVRERDAAEETRYNLAENRKAVEEGSKSGVASGTPAYDAMEKALSKLSEKETEALVTSNRELLKSLNFANAISVKQLEAINKSDQFSENEKGGLKSMRFKAINDAMRAGGPGASAVAKNIKSLADSELEMVDSKYLEDEDFVGQLKGSQVDAINKSNKFTSSTKDKVGKARMAPVINAINRGSGPDAKTEFRKADVKTKIKYLRTPTRPGGIAVGLHNYVLDTYTPKTLSKIAAHDDITDVDISTLRSALIAALPPTDPTIKWLNDPNKGMLEFPP